MDGAERPTSQSPRARSPSCAATAGAFVGTDTSKFHGEGLTELHAASTRRMVDPTAADARVALLHHELQQAQQSSDRVPWRVLAGELYALMLLDGRAEVPAGLGGREGRRLWMEAAVRHHELSVFDAELLQLQHTTNAAVGELLGTDLSIAELVQRAERVLAAALAFSEAVYDHPEFIATGHETPAKRLAQDRLRTSLATYQTMLGPDRVGQILHRVLGDEDASSGHRCNHCGASFDAKHLSVCPHCQGRVSVVQSGQELETLVALWSTQAREHATSTNAQQAVAAVSCALTSWYLRHEPPTVDLMTAFLQRTVGHCSQQDVVAAATMLATAFEDQAPLAERLRALTVALESWTETGTPPAPPTAGPTPSNPEAWIETNLAQWAYIRASTKEADRPAALVTMMLTQFFLGATLDAQTGLTFAQRAEPQGRRFIQTQ